MTNFEAYTHAVIKPNRRPKSPSDIEAMEGLKADIKALHKQSSVTERDYEKLLRGIDELYEHMQDGLTLETAIEYTLL